MAIFHKVTPTKCLDSKRHNWRTIAFEGYPNDTKYITKRCSKCGSVTEFTRLGYPWSKNRRCVEDDGSYHIEIPELIKRAMG